jgi:hypothetical protein
MLNDSAAATLTEEPPPSPVPFLGVLVVPEDDPPFCCEAVLPFANPASAFPFESLPVESSPSPLAPTELAIAFAKVFECPLAVNEIGPRVAVKSRRITALTMWFDTLTTIEAPTAALPPDAAPLAVAIDDAS